MDKLDWKIRQFLVEQGYLFPITDSEIEYSLKKFNMEKIIEHLKRNAEQYRKEANEADNDMKSFVLYEKANREYRMVDFLQGTLPKLKEKTKVVHEDIAQGLFTIETEKFGTIDIYPKRPAAKIRKPQKWYRGQPATKIIKTLTD